MALPAPKVVAAAAPIIRPIPEPQILWPTYVGYGDNGQSDSTVFPRLAAIKSRHGARPPDALTAFVEATWSAQDRILILDGYLLGSEKGSVPQVRYDEILFWFTDGLAANEIRILTSGFADPPEQQEIKRQFDERAQRINQISPRRGGKVKIEISFSLGATFPYVHDRFAIVDNELWHFGATVGGLHVDVNAATRGWDANAHQAVRFFDEAWAGDTDLR